MNRQRTAQRPCTQKPAAILDTDLPAREVADEKRARDGRLGALGTVMDASGSDMPYSPAMPSNAGSSYPLETEIRTLWRIYQESGLSARLMRLRSISTSSTAVSPDVPASAGILLVRDVGVEIAGALNPDLRDALRDLEGTVGEAREEGFPTPSDVALEYARRLLCSVYELSPRRYEIYPTPDGEVAIDAPGGFGRSVLVLCGSDGGALCLVNMSGSHRRARYSDAKTFPDGFVREALVELDRGSYPAA